jgi:hypothetical protein
MTCDWCGHGHDRAALCTKRPRWSRRGFLVLTATGLAAMTLPGGFDWFDQFEFPDIGPEGMAFLRALRERLMMPFEATITRTSCVFPPHDGTLRRMALGYDVLTRNGRGHAPVEGDELAMRLRHYLLPTLRAVP